LGSLRWRPGRGRHLAPMTRTMRKERRDVMKTMRVLLLLILAVALARSTAAEEPDAELIAKITGLKPDVENGIAKISVPRGDHRAARDGGPERPGCGECGAAGSRLRGREHPGEEHDRLKAARGDPRCLRAGEGRDGEILLWPQDVHARHGGRRGDGREHLGGFRGEPASRGGRWRLRDAR